MRQFSEHATDTYLIHILQQNPPPSFHNVQKVNCGQHRQREARVHLCCTDNVALSVSRRGLGVGRPEEDRGKTSYLFPIVGKEMDR